MMPIFQGPSGQIIILLALLDLVLKSFALWKAARNNQKYWFISLTFLNTAGILPLFYMRYFQHKRLAK